MTDPSPPADLDRILRAAVAAVDPARLVAGSLADEPVLQDWAAALASTPPLRAGVRVADRSARPRLVLLSVGRDAVAMARGGVQLLGDLVDAGVVLAPRGHGPRPGWLPPQVDFRTGGHPLPDAAGVAASRAVADLLHGLGPADRLLVLLSEGAPSLLTLPVQGVTVEEVAAAIRHLSDAGLDPGDGERVRSALNQLGPGDLGRRAAPVRTLALLLPGSGGGASGTSGSALLTFPGEGGRGVEILLRRQGRWNGLSAAVRSAISSREPRPAPALELTLRTLGRGESPLEGAARAARRCGYRVLILSRDLRGEAGQAGAGMARAATALQDGVVPADLPTCLLAAGELGVGSPAPGRGRLNEQVAQGSALRLQGRKGIEVGSVEAAGRHLLVALVTR